MVSTINDDKYCIHCGVCKKNCDFLTKYDIVIGDTGKLKELAYHCFLCGKCTEVCPVHIDGRAEVLDLRREYAAEHMSELEDKYKGAFGEKRNYRFRNWKHITEECVFFPGCNFPSLFPKTNDVVSKIFEKHGIGTVYDCCGKPVAELGSIEDEDRIIEEIKFKLQENNIKEIIFACPNCREHFGNRLGVKVSSVFSKLEELGEGQVYEGDVKFFIPCPDKELKQWVDEIRPFINGNISYVEGIQCCGLGGHAGHIEPDLSQGFADKFKANEHGQVFAYCASCTGRLKRNGFDSIDHILTKILGTNEKPDTAKSYVHRMMTKYK